MLPEYLGEGYEVINNGKSGRTMLKDGKISVGKLDYPISYWLTKEWADAQ